MDITELFTNEKAQRGKKISVTKADGTETGQWMIVRSVDSEAYETAIAEQREVLADEEATTDQIKDAMTRAYASLVADWSFDTPCTPENVFNLLKNAKYLREEIATVAGDRKRFFSEEASDS